MAACPTKASRAPATPPSPSPENSPSSSMWSDLPPDLAGLILGQFRSLADRVRFGSVCRHWRHAARQQAPLLPQTFLWTINSFTGKVQTIPDGEVHNLCSCSDKLALRLLSCSSENWLLITGINTESRYFLENPLSGVTLPLPSPDDLLSPGGEFPCFKKFLLCPDNLVVATIRSPIPPYCDPLIYCRPGTSSWSTASTHIAAGGDPPSCYEDIAFHDGSIYAITKGGDLFAHEVISDGPGVAKKPATPLSPAKLVIRGSDDDSWGSGASRFLMVSPGGRLLMVRWNHRWSMYHDDDGISAFEVFETDAQMSRWSRLSSIGDQVLFLSESCSKAVTLSSDHGDYLRGNHIYFLASANFGPQKCCSGHTSCGMYDLRNNTYHPIVLDIEATAWFFPRK